MSYRLSAADTSPSSMPFDVADAHSNQKSGLKRFTTHARKLTHANNEKPLTMFTRKTPSKSPPEKIMAFYPAKDTIQNISGGKMNQIKDKKSTSPNQGAFPEISKIAKPLNGSK
jgi:hypothetical protein